MNDERRGLPSASKFESYQLCLGKFMAEAGLPDLPPSPDAQHGLGTHALLAGQAEWEDCTVECVEEANSLHKLWEKVYDPWREECSQIADLHIHSEIRLYLFDPFTNDAIATARLDRIAICDDSALIVDFKTGYTEAIDASRNLQLRLQAVLARERWDLSNVRVAIVQKGNVSVCDYAKNELVASWAQMISLSKTITQEGLPRQPGAVQCKYCKAQDLCPERLEAFRNLPSKFERSGEFLDPIQISKLLDSCALAKDVIKRAESMAKDKLKENPDSIPGWYLEPGNLRREIVKTDQLFQVLSDCYGISASEFVGISKTPIGAVHKLVELHTGSNAKSVALMLGPILDAVCETKTTAPSLARRKE